MGVFDPLVPEGHQAAYRWVKDRALGVLAGYRALELEFQSKVVTLRWFHQEEIRLVREAVESTVVE